MSKSCSILVALLGVHAGLLAWSALRHSPTLNEPGFLAAGISHWQFGRFELYRVNPPLVRMVAALPVMATGCETDWSGYYEGPGARPVFEVGSDFVAANGERSIWLFTLARWACIPFSLAGALVCYFWARDLYGSRAGLLAATMWCFSPNVLGHASLMTTDAPAAALGVAAGYLFWRWLKQPSWGRTLAAGIALGLAELVKTTLVVFYPLWPILWIMDRLSDHSKESSRPWIREGARLSAVMLISIYIINIGYFFEGSFTKLDDFQFVSETLAGDGGESPNNRFAGTLLGEIPVPLPKDYLLGIDIQRRDFEDYDVPCYLRGRFQDTGWWYYYLYALGVKVPLGTWSLLLLTAAFRTVRKLPRQRRSDEIVLLAPAFIVLAVASSQTGINHHMRYVLPIFPFVFVWTGQIARVFRFDSLKMAVVAASALVWSVGGSLWHYPHSLSYFNELAGGPAGGHAHLIGSNIDWGQDLLDLKAWQGAHPEARPLFLAAVGMYDPADIGIAYKPLPDNPSGDLDLQPGWYTISIHRLHDPRGKFDVFLREDTPMERIGYSLWIYHVR